MNDNPNPFLELFGDPEHAARYAEGPARFVPGFNGLHRMAGVLIREFAPQDAHVLVHGAGGGLEIEAFAIENPEWTFVGVDPARPMLDEAKARLSDLGERVTFHHGYAEDAPDGPFDAATSFLTLHFLDAAKRRQTLADIVRRLKPGAPLVTAHVSFPQDPEHRDAWLNRHQEYVIAAGVDEEDAAKARNDIQDSLEVFDPEVDEELLRDAGLSDVTQFYAAFTWRGWVGRAS